MESIVEKVCDHVCRMDPEGDPIAISKQIKSLGENISKFCDNDEILGCLFRRLNECALQSERVAINMAPIFTSPALQASIRLANANSTIRREILKILQTNFMRKYFTITIDNSISVNYYMYVLTVYSWSWFADCKYNMRRMRFLQLSSSL